MFVEMDRYSKVVKRKSDKLKELALKDPYWNINYIKSVVEDTFIVFSMLGMMMNMKGLRVYLQLHYIISISRF